MKTRLLITDEIFQKLIKGEVVETDNSEIALQDIGYLRMISLLKKELNNLYKNNE